MSGDVMRAAILLAC